MRRVVVVVCLGVSVIAPASAQAADPALPRVLLDTTPVASTGSTITVGAGGDFQAALDAAQPGDAITLQAGAIFVGPFTLPNKTGPGWITVRTSAPDGSLPPPGERVTPSHAAVMPKLVVGPGQGGAVQTAPGAHHFRFVGVEIRPQPAALVYGLVELGRGDEATEAALPHDIVIDRCYIHGNPGEPAVRGVALNGAALAVVDSHLAEFKDNFVDTQAVMGWNGPGPFKIVNNHLEAAGENVMFGGADPSIVGLVPSDIEIRQNHFYKPLAWRGVWAAVKNLFELKNARRVLVEGNVLEYAWLAGQAGFAVQLTVRNQDGTAPWSTIEDVTFVNNLIRHAGSGINVLGSDDPQLSQSMARVLIRDNVFDDIDGTTWGGAGRLFQILDYRRGTTDIAIEHNTAFQSGSVIYTEAVEHNGFVYRDNLTPRGDYGVIGQGSAEGSDTIATYFPDGEFRRNVIVGASESEYPPENFFPASFSSVDFVDQTSGNYRLAPTSPYRNAGTDGLDIGADIDAVESGTAGVTAGVPAAGGGDGDATPPTVTITAPAGGATVSGPAVSVSAAAGDDVGVVRVQLQLDGADLGAPLTAPPYTLSWDSTMAAPGQHTLTAQAVDAAGNTGTSAAVTVMVANANPVPTLTSLTPARISAGSTGFILTVDGANFVTTSRVRWNGAARPTKFVSAGRLTAHIFRVDVLLPGAATVTVVTPEPGGGTSSPATFTIESPLPLLGAASPERRVGDPLGAGRRAAELPDPVAGAADGAGGVGDHVTASLVEVIQRRGARVGDERRRRAREGAGVAQDRGEPDLVDPAAVRRIGRTRVGLLGADDEV